MSCLLISVFFLAQAAVLHLEDCLQIALAENPEVSLSQRGVTQAQARRQGARAGYLPRLDVFFQEGYLLQGEQDRVYSDGQISYEIQIPASQEDTHSFGFHLAQNIYDGGKMWQQVRRADRDLDRSRLQVQVTREDVAMEVIAAFYQLLKAQEALRVFQESLTLSQGQLALVQERLRLGADSKVDVAKAQVSVGEDRIAIERQWAVVEKAKIELNLRMGRLPTDALEIAEAVPDSPATSQAASDASLDKNLRLRQLRLTQELTRLDVDLIGSERWPQVTGSVSYSRQHPEFYKVYSRFDELYSLTFFLRVNFPIFDGFLTSARIEEAEAQVNWVTHEQRRVRQELAAQAGRAEKDLLRLDNIARIESQNLQAAGQQLALAEERYQVGEGTALELRDAQLAVTRARLSRVQTEYDAKIAQARSYHAHGDLMDHYLKRDHP